MRPPKLLIFGITITGILNNTLIGPSLPDIVADFGRSDSSAGLIVAAGSLPGIVVAPAIGLAADRFGRRNVLTPCLLAFSVFGLCAAAAPTFELLVVARLLQGFGTAGLINLAVVLISDHWDGVERTALIGRNAAVLTLGLAVAPPVGGVIADLAGWRASLLLYAVGLPAAASVWRLLPEDRPDAASSMGDQLRGARVALRNPVVLATLGSGVLVFVMIFGGFLTAFPVHLEQEFGLGAAARGAMIAVPALSSCLIAFNLGRIRERYPLKVLLVIAGCTYVVAFAGIAASGVLSGIVLAGVIYGIGEGVFIPSLQDAVAEAAPPEQRGAVFAVWVGAARLGQTLGPLLVAGVLTFTTTTGVFVLASALAVVLLLAQVFGPIGRTADPAAIGGR
ncbi:MFS transporter [Actinospongicola halichondriae]|uniref:MFS transporter n=1 Tax=Actinospongicola halichondriae TaxID=3236844 RepID=UPI003D5A4613